MSESYDMDGESCEQQGIGRNDQGSEKVLPVLIRNTVRTLGGTSKTSFILLGIYSKTVLAW
jgi:hypothetical protein